MNNPVSALFDCLVSIGKGQPGANIFAGLGYSLEKSLGIAFTIWPHNNALTF
jgi:hypothetical protein